MRDFFNMDNGIFRALGRLADLMMLNLVFLLCCIPIVTIGAALTGLNYVTLKMAENEEGYIIKSFFKSFRENFKQATVIWLILLGIGLLLGADFYIMQAASKTLGNVFRVLLAAASFFYAIILLYIFPELARFYNTTKTTFKNAFIMAVADFPRTIAMIAITAGAVILTLLNTYTIVYGILVWLLAGFSLLAYINGFFFKKIFARYTPKEEEETPNPDHWSVDETLGKPQTDSAKESSEI